MNEETAARLKRLDDALMRYVRPDTFPLAIRMLKPGEPLPDDVRITSRDLNEQWIVCQSIGVARRYGWGIAAGMYCENEKAAAKLEAGTWKFEPGSYDYVCVAPLARAHFEPHVMAVYANSAQVLRLVHAALYRQGGRVVSTTGGRLDCAEIVIQTMTTNEPKVILPCTGDRVFDMAQDSEMVFACPWEFADDIIAGLEGTHQGGIRYPITVALRSTVSMPKTYQDLMKMLEERDKESSG